MIYIKKIVTIFEQIVKFKCIGFQKMLKLFCHKISHYYGWVILIECF